MQAAETTHTFAFYTEVVRSLVRESRTDFYQLTDPELVYRMISILRLEKGDRIVLFDNYHHVKAIIRGVDGKKSMGIEIHEISPNKQLTPSIEWVLPLLKREAFEEALYTLTELGAQSIQPVLTHKTIRFFGGERETMRCQKILKAAAEQAKQYVLPHLHPIIPFEMWLAKEQPASVAKIFFDPTGLPLSEVIALVERQKHQHIIACAGPEGDLTPDEKMMLDDRGFVRCALTPTVLRAQQAVAVGLGALRSLLR